MHEILNDQENAIELVHRVQLQRHGFLGVQYWLCHYGLHSLRVAKRGNGTISSRLIRIHKSHHKKLDLGKEKWSRGPNIAAKYGLPRSICSAINSPCIPKVDPLKTYKTNVLTCI